MNLNWKRFFLNFADSITVEGALLIRRSFRTLMCALLAIIVGYMVFGTLKGSVISGAAVLIAGFGVSGYIYLKCRSARRQLSEAQKHMAVVAPVFKDFIRTRGDCIGRTDLRKVLADVRVNGQQRAAAEYMLKNIETIGRAVKVTRKNVIMPMPVGNLSVLPSSMNSTLYAITNGDIGNHVERTRLRLSRWL